MDAYPEIRHFGGTVTIVPVPVVHFPDTRLKNPCCVT